MSNLIRIDRCSSTRSSRFTIERIRFGVDVWSIRICLSNYIHRSTYLSLYLRVCLSERESTYLRVCISDIVLGSLPAARSLHSVFQCSSRIALLSELPERLVASHCVIVWKSLYPLTTLQLPLNTTERTNSNHGQQIGTIATLSCRFLFFSFERDFCRTLGSLPFEALIESFEALTESFEAHYMNLQYELS